MYENGTNSQSDQDTKNHIVEGTIGICAVFLMFLIAVAVMIGKHKRAKRRDNLKNEEGK